MYSRILVSFLKEIYSLKESYKYWLILQGSCKKCKFAQLGCKWFKIIESLQRRFYPSVNSDFFVTFSVISDFLLKKRQKLSNKYYRNISHSQNTTMWEGVNLNTHRRKNCLSKFIFLSRFELIFQPSSVVMVLTMSVSFPFGKPDKRSCFFLLWTSISKEDLRWVIRFL